MPFTDEIKALYRVLDSATLLALLPELRYQAEGRKRGLEMMHKAAVGSQESDVDLAEQLGEALAAIQGRVPPEAFETLRDQFAEARAALEFDPEDHHATLVEPLFAELVELTDRDRWIVDELKRRRLLPGEPFLD